MAITQTPREREREVMKLPALHLSLFSISLLSLQGKTIPQRNRERIKEAQTVYESRSSLHTYTGKRGVVGKRERDRGIERATGKRERKAVSPRAQNKAR